MRLPLVCIALFLTACPNDGSSKAEPTPDTKAKAAAKPEPATKDETKAPEPKPAPEATPKPQPPKKDDGPLATLSADVKFPLATMLGKKPAEIQPHLGDPTGKGISRKSCVRFLPERTWFECDYAMQRYVDPTSTYAAITITYEDGVSTGIAFEGVPGEGEFDPNAALAHVGVELVGQPKESNPSENVKLWSWFNSAARMLVHGKQYRAEVSSVGGTWDTSRVEFFLNHPLTAEQKTKIRPATSAGSSSAP